MFLGWLVADWVSGCKSLLTPSFYQIKPPGTLPCKNLRTPHLFQNILMRVSQILVVREFTGWHRVNRTLLYRVTVTAISRWSIYLWPCSFFSKSPDDSCACSTFHQRRNLINSIVITRPVCSCQALRFLTSLTKKRWMSLVETDVPRNTESFNWLLLRK